MNRRRRKKNDGPAKGCSILLEEEAMVKSWSSSLARTAALTLSLVLVAGVFNANAWWDKNWQYRKKLAIDLSEKGANIKENLTDVPVLVRLHTGNFSFANAKKDGTDLRFVSADDKVPLKFHIEKFDPKQEIALVWVRVSQLAGGGNQDAVWLYYGNDSASGGLEEAGGTYDTGQVLVYHLSEADGAPKDATSYGNHASAFAGTHGTPAAIGNGFTFKGTGEKIVVQRTPSLNFAKGFSYSAWVRIDQPQNDAHLFSWDDGGQSIVVGIDQERPYLRVGVSGKQPVVSDKKGTLTLKAWHHLAITADSEKQLAAVYLDGRQVSAMNLFAPLPSPAGEIAMGASMKGQNAFAGDLDEVEIASSVRPAAWMAAAFAGQGQDGKLTTLQQEESGNGGGENLTIRLIKVTAKSITFDGWAIIALCTTMLFLAAGVFISKFTRLQKIKKGNEAFLESFNSLHDPLELDQEDDTFENSTLFRIYQAGYNQLMHWAEKHGKDQEDVVLTTSALNIFRAALDRANSDEVRKMNAWMIVLTLGISGGPFWGLLGTVWGVMNTFASLAEAGEANLSAIAPGVASALACTLFGLFVAIPALFAYSFLVMHMKNLNVETRHFIEEYALRVEGFHGEDA
jgi:biopolymer transport protein ExbB